MAPQETSLSLREAPGTSWPSRASRACCSPLGLCGALVLVLSLSLGLGLGLGLRSSGDSSSSASVQPAQRFSVEVSIPLDMAVVPSSCE